ncbi:MAG TPA: hypothetical protein VFS36_12740 [Chitinophagaceae bacterium]|jgi:hypothetical protein|nr:hypothetical protein [Chitinophagaceae bacterium]
MISPSTTNPLFETPKPESLQQLVSRLALPFYSTAIHNRTRLVNVIAPGIMIVPHEGVTAIISHLLSTVITQARDSYITITAEQFGDVVTLEVQDNSSYNSYAVACRVEQYRGLAQTLGGNLGINGCGKKVTTVTFSFPFITTAA